MMTPEVPVAVAAPAQHAMGVVPGLHYWPGASATWKRKVFFKPEDDVKMGGFLCCL